LIKDPARRIGNQRGSVGEIKKHAYFRNVDFVKIFLKRAKAPWVPKLNGPADVSCFKPKDAACFEKHKGEAIVEQDFDWDVEFSDDSINVSALTLDNGNSDSMPKDLGTLLGKVVEFYKKDDVYYMLSMERHFEAPSWFSLDEIAAQHSVTEGTSSAVVPSGAAISSSFVTARSGSVTSVNSKAGVPPPSATSESSETNSLVKSSRTFQQTRVESANNGGGVLVEQTLCTPEVLSRAIICEPSENFWKW